MRSFETASTNFDHDVRTPAAAPCTFLPLSQNVPVNTFLDPIFKDEYDIMAQESPVMWWDY